MRLYLLSFCVLNRVGTLTHDAQMCTANDLQQAIERATQASFDKWPKDQGNYGHSISVIPIIQPFLDFLKGVLNDGSLLSDPAEHPISISLDPATNTDGASLEPLTGDGH